MNKYKFKYRGIDRFYIEGTDGNFYRQSQLEAGQYESEVCVQDLERAGFTVAVCEFPMSKWSTLNHVVVYASHNGSHRFRADIARLVNLGNGRLANKMFLCNGRVSDRPIDGYGNVTFVTAV